MFQVFSSWDITSSTFYLWFTLQFTEGSQQQQEEVGTVVMCDL